MEAGSNAPRQAPPPPPPVRLVERLADKLGSSAHSAAVFGQPVERDGVTVIPVAKARWGFGGGGGRPLVQPGETPPPPGAEPGERHGGRQGEGTRGGGGVAVAPVGFIEVRADGARFRRIVDQSAIISLAAMALVAAAMGWRIAVRLTR